MLLILSSSLSESPARGGTETELSLLLIVPVTGVVLSTSVKTISEDVFDASLPPITDTSLHVSPPKLSGQTQGSIVLSQ